MTQQDKKDVLELTQIADIFIDIYGCMKRSHYTECVTGISDPDEVNLLNAGIAAVFTLNRMMGGRNNEII